MLHIFTCKTCGAEFERYCFMGMNYTEAGNAVLKRQLATMQCFECLGETPELKPVEELTGIPCVQISMM